MDRLQQADIVAVETDITRKDIVKKTRQHLLEHNSQVKSFSTLDETLQLAELDKWKSLLEKFDIKLPKNSKNKTKQYITYLETFFDFVLQRIGRDKGIETVLIPQAIEQGKPVVDLEMFEDQILSLSKKYENSIELPNENINLEELIANFKRDWKKQFGGLESAIKWGYSEMMSFALNMSKKEDIEASNFRNFKMVMKIAELMNNHTFPFMMIGALHFPGEMGLINLLEKSGYSCNRIVVYEPSRLA